VLFGGIGRERHGFVAIVLDIASMWAIYAGCLAIFVAALKANS